MTILVQSFLNSATKLSTTATTATTVAQLKTLVNALEGVSTSVMEFYIKNPSTTSTVLVSGTLGSYGITTATTIYSSNNISALVSGITADSHTASFQVEVGKFTYDAYGTGFVVRKDGGPIDAYMTRVLALPEPSARQYVFDQIDPPEARPFTYGQALISFTLNASGTFSNVVCTFGAGGYSASSGQLTMPGDRLIGGVSPANDIVWDYVCAANNGVITSFSYSSGTPPTGRLWTFVPANGQPSFTRAMNPPDGTQFSTEASDGFAAMWNVTTDSDSFLQGTGVNELDISLIPMGTEFNIYATELGAGPDKVGKQLAKLELAQLRRQAAGNTTTNYYRSRNIYDIDLLADKYTSNTSTVGTTSTLVIGRPWIAYTIVTSGLRLYLDAGNSSSYSGSGTSWVDLSNNTNDATLVGSPAFTNAGASSYFTFPNDINKYATTPHTKYSGTYTGKTTFFVARMDASIAADGYYGIFGFNPDRTFNTYIYKQPGPVYQVHASFGGVSTNGWSDNLTLAAGQWFTFGATQAANGDMTFYFNGGEVGVTTELTFTNTYSSGTDPQLIGANGNVWHGDVAVVTVYDRALSGAEMTQNHNAILGRYGL